MGERLFYHTPYIDLTDLIYKPLFSTSRNYAAQAKWRLPVVEAVRIISCLPFHSFLSLQNPVEFCKKNFSHILHNSAKFPFCDKIKDCESVRYIYYHSASFFSSRSRLFFMAA
jgi:hypothetical protein